MPLDRDGRPLVSYGFCRLFLLVRTLALVSSIEECDHAVNNHLVLAGSYATAGTGKKPGRERRFCSIRNIQYPAAAAARCFRVWPLTMCPSSKIGLSRISKTFART